MSFFSCFCKCAKAKPLLSKPYITTDDVRRANAAMMEGRASASPSVYERYNLRRPTSEELEQAGRQAMRAVMNRNSYR